jgi:hypothetical protein
MEEEMKLTETLPTPPTGLTNKQYKRIFRRWCKKTGGGANKWRIIALGFEWPVDGAWKKRLFDSWKSGNPIVVKPPKIHKATRYSAKRQKDLEFYRSWEWKNVRFHILKEYGAFCMLCGSKERICVDHIKPRSKFPALELDYDNMQVLCNDCNMGKSNDDYTDFRGNNPS